MKKIILTIVLFLYISLISSTKEFVKKQPSEIDRPALNITAKRVHVVMYINNSTSKSGIQSSITPKIETETNFDQDNQQDNKQQQDDQAHTLLESSTMLNHNFLKNQKLHSFSSYKGLIIYPLIIAGATSYTLCIITYYRMKKLLKNPSAWCNWKPHAMLKDSKKIFIQELLEAIEKKNFEKETPTHYIPPMMEFLKDIESEYTILNHYMFTAKWAHRIYFDKILPGHDMQLIVQEKLNRLDYIKDIFFEWAQSQRSRKIKELTQSF